MEAVEINLPGGVPVGEQWHRSARLRPVTGCEEEFLLQEGKLLSPAARATQLITRCLCRLGPLEPVCADLVRQLSVGDREAILLHLRRLTLGGRISCLLSCPCCGKKMDLDLQVDELLLPQYASGRRLHEIDVSEYATSYHVVFRVPNGEDQEAAVLSAAKSVDAAAELVLRRCIESITTQDGGTPNEIPAVVMQQLSER